MKKLIVVGSSVLEKDYSCVIDSADCVMRFNNCKNYNKNSGSKTDILVLNNSGDPMGNVTLSFMLEDRGLQQLKTELPYVIDTKEVWFSSPNPIFLKSFLKEKSNKNNPLLEQELRGLLIFRNLSVEIIKAQKLQSKNIIFMTNDLYSKVWTSLKKCGSTHGVIPSTGILGIAMLLENPQFKHYDKYITGFTFQGWEGHTWNQEKLYIEKLLSSGKLKLLRDNV